MRKTRSAALALGALAVVGVTLLSGCSAPTSDDSTGTISQADIDKAMTTPTELVYWTWVPDIEDEVALFEKKYPAIDVKVENVGQGAPHYQKIRTAIDAGEGAPDVAQIEYQFLPSFEITESLLDLTPYGAAELKDDFAQWLWNQVARDDSVIAMPQDAGPMGYLYREDLFTQSGVTEPPATYEDFADAAVKVHDATGSYITTFAPNNAGQILGLLWQAGVRPFSYSGGEEVGISVNSDGAKQVMAYWQDLIQKGAINVDPNFTDEWYRQFAEGDNSGWLTAAWAPVFLQGTAADTAGLWRAAPLPQWEAGQEVSGNWGGSSTAVIKGTKNDIAAAMFAQWLGTDHEAGLMFATQQLLYPVANSVLEDPAFVDLEAEFYGGQKVNALFADISNTVDPEFQWVPFMDVAFSTYDETIGKAIAAKGDLSAGLDAWQDALVQYATEQGFTIK